MSEIEHQEQSAAVAVDQATPRDEFAGLRKQVAQARPLSRIWVGQESLVALIAENDRLVAEIAAERASSADKSGQINVLYRVCNERDVLRGGMRRAMDHIKAAAGGWALLDLERAFGHPETPVTDAIAAASAKGKKEGVEACIQIIDGGYFLHDKAPTRLWANDLIAKIRSELSARG